MKKQLNNPVFGVIADTAEGLGMETYVIGGFVRDLLLKRPSKDVDIVVIGSGITFAKSVAKGIYNKGLAKSTPKVTVYKNFGTAQLKLDDLEIEFVGARKESYRANSRKPIVEDGTLEDDQNRRDFTINALALSLNKVRFGELLDPFDGVNDLKSEIIKTPLDPHLTFSDDPLRMMRAIRFATQLEFRIDQKSYDAIIKNKQRLSIVSNERIIDELNKMILSQTPSIGFKLLFNTGLLHMIFPEMVRLEGVDIKDGVAHKDNFYHTLKVLDNVALESDDLWLRWAAIMHDIAKPPTKRFHKKAGWTFHGHEDKGARMVPGIFKRMKLPTNEKMRFVQKMVFLHLRPIALVKDIVTDSAVRRLLFEAGDDVDKLMILCNADITSKNEYKVNRYKKNFDLVMKKLVEVEEKDKIRNFQPPITGEIIMKTFDIKPCKKVGDLKNSIKDAIIEGEIKNDYDEAYAFMLKQGEELGLVKV